MRLLLCVVAIATAAAAEVRLPRYTRSILPNGIVLNVMPRGDVPLVTIRVVVRGGIESTPEGLAGLPSVTAEALRRGTAKRTAEQFSRELDALGGTWSAGVDNQSSYVATEILAKDLGTGLDLLIDALVRPAFPEAEIKKLLAQRIDAAKAAKDASDGGVGQYYAGFFYGASHPYGHPPDELSYARITREHIVDYHKRMYTGRNMIVIVAGDIDPETAGKQVAAALAAVPEGQAYSWRKPAPLASQGTRVLVVDKPDATQTRFLIGQPGIDRTHPDRVALWLVNTLFGGRFTSILNDELRVNTGLTYGAGSRFSQDRMPGALTISTFTSTPNTGKAVDLAVSLLKRLRERGITAEQLASAKAYLKGTFPSERLETTDQLAGMLSEIELFDLNRGEVDDLFARIDAVTVEKANEVAKRYYKDDALTFVLLGNAAEFEAELKKYTSAPVTVPITKPGFAAGR